MHVQRPGAAAHSQARAAQTQSPTAPAPPIPPPTQRFPSSCPGREWRAKRATPCQAEVVAIFAWERELLLRRVHRRRTSEHHQQKSPGRNRAAGRQGDGGRTAHPLNHPIADID